MLFRIAFQSYRAYCSILESLTLRFLLPFGDLWATHTVYLRLIGMLVADS